MVPHYINHAIAKFIGPFAGLILVTSGIASAQSVPNFVGARPAPASDLERSNESDAKRKAEREFNRLAIEAETNQRAAANAEAEKATMRDHAEQVRLGEERRAEDARRTAERDAAAAKSMPAGAAPSAETNAQPLPPTAVPPDAPPPVSTPAPQPRQATSDAKQQDAARYVSRGIALLKQGDIVQARGFFERAADLGSAEAALILAQTYDGRTLKTWRVVGLVENKERAVFWYFKAQMLGSKEAGDALKSLSP